MRFVLMMVGFFGIMLLAGWMLIQLLNAVIGA